MLERVLRVLREAGGDVLVLCAFVAGGGGRRSVG
jgi:hypothetical protein